MCMHAAFTTSVPRAFTEAVKHRVISTTGHHLKNTLLNQSLLMCKEGPNRAERMQNCMSTEQQGFAETFYCKHAGTRSQHSGRKDAVRLCVLSVSKKGAHHNSAKSESVRSRCAPYFTSYPVGYASFGHWNRHRATEITARCRAATIAASTTSGNTAEEELHAALLPLQTRGSSVGV